MKRRSKHPVLLSLLGLVFIAIGIYTYSISCGQLCKLTTSRNTPNTTSLKITLPINKMQSLHGVDSAYIENTFTDEANTFYKMLVYTNSTSCSPCAIDRMHAWNDIIEQFAKYKVKWVFIISPQQENIEDMYLAIEYSYLKCAIYVDTAYVFLRENKDVLNIDKDQPLLLDNDNSIIAIGNPLKDINVQSNMIRILQSKSNTNN